MKDYGAIIGVGIIAVLLIWFATQLGFSANIVRGVIFIAISILLFLVSGAVFSHSWIVGSVVGVIALVLLFVGINVLATPDNNKSTQLLPTLTQLILLKYCYPL
jgi:hypothetical protein